MTHVIETMVDYSPPLLSHLGFVQFEVVPGNPSANLDRLTATLQRLHPPPLSLLLLPELWATGFAYRHLGQLLSEVEWLLKELQPLAARFNILLAGSLPETSPGSTKFFNTLWLVGAEGVIGRTRKTHLFPGEEIAFVASTEAPIPVKTPLGSFGAMICYDLRFPDIARRQAMQGADWLICSAQWPAARLAHLRDLAVARAIENQTYLAVCNGVGKNGEVPLGGGSLIVAPSGKILAAAGNGTQVEMVRVDWQLVQDARSVFRSFSVDPAPIRAGDKLVNVTACLERLAARRRTGQRLVYCRWDGKDETKTISVTLLEAARRRGDFLVVAVGDSIAAGDRVLLAALACVDMVVEGAFSKEEEQWFCRNCLAEPLSASVTG
jgi:D-glycero-beta-D-manno-heptose 1-phosphate adenylyltransferase